MKKKSEKSMVISYVFITLLKALATPALLID